MLLLRVRDGLLLLLGSREVDVLGEVCNEGEVFKGVLGYWTHLVENEEGGEKNCKCEDFDINVGRSLSRGKPLSIYQKHYQII